MRQTHNDIRRKGVRVPLPESVGNMAGSTGSTRTDDECRERQGTLLPDSGYERPMDRDLNKVIGNVQCRRLNEECLILPSGIPAYWKVTNERVVGHYQGSTHDDQEVSRTSC